MTATESDDGRVWYTGHRLHRTDIQQRDGLFVDRQPDSDPFQITVATAGLDLGVKESCSEERPLPCACQVNSDTVCYIPALQRRPFVRYSISYFPAKKKKKFKKIKKKKLKNFHLIFIFIIILFILIITLY